MPIVTFIPLGRTVVVDEGGSLLDATRHARLPLASSCRGVGICDACRVRVTEGRENLSELTRHEEGATLAEDERLACQAHVRGAVTVTTSYW